MQKITVDDPESRSADIVAKNLDQLKALFPEVFIEEKVDFQVLKQILGSAVDEREEKFGLNWHGKRQARQLALTPSTGTLRPCPEESVDWDTTQNLMIEGDNLEVLKLLQKSYAGKVKLIYIDPPYNTGKDFVYPDCYRDNIQNYLKLTGQVDGENHKFSSNTESSGRFHTDWLNMMYPRLRLARQLLRQDGLILVSIDDHEVFTLRSILDEIFGTENFLATVVWQKKYSTKADSKYFSESHEFLICYRKSDLGVVHGVARSESQEGTYKNLDRDPRGPWASDNLLRTEVRDYAIYAVQSPSGNKHWPPAGSSWRFTQDRMESLIEDNRIWFGRTGQSKPRLKRFRTDVRESIPPQTLWAFNEVGHTDEGTKELAELFGSTRSPFPNPKPVRLLQRVIEIGAGPDDIVLDFFGGSATLGHAVFAQNTLDAGSRPFIVVQIPELLNPDRKEDQAAIYFCDQLGKPHNLAELTKERLRLAGAKVRGEHPAFTGDLNQGQGGMCISGRLTMTERTPRHLISPLGPNWVGTDSAV